MRRSGAKTSGYNEESAKSRCRHHWRRMDRPADGQGTRRAHFPFRGRARARRRAPIGGLRRRHGRARLQRPLPHDAGLFAGDGHAALHGARPRRAHPPARQFPARDRAPAARANTGARCARATWPIFSSCIRKTVERYGAKRLPEDHAMVDWGVTWNEIEPYYTRGDKLLGVSGKAGNIAGKLIEGGNPFEGPRSEEYPTPPMKLPYVSSLFEDAAKIAGLSPVSQSGRDAQRAVHQSRRRFAARLRLLRILRPLRLHDRREGPADEYAAAAGAEAEEHLAAEQLLGAPHRVR